MGFGGGSQKIEKPIRGDYEFISSILDRILTPALSPLSVILEDRIKRKRPDIRSDLVYAGGLSVSGEGFVMVSSIDEVCP